MHGNNAHAFYMTGAVSLDKTQDITISITLDNQGVLLASVRHTMVAPTTHFQLEYVSILYIHLLKPWM